MRPTGESALQESRGARAAVAAGASPAPAPRPPSVRLAWLDAARCVAIVLMVFAHFSDQLLAVPSEPSLFLTWYGKTRGITAPLFFVVAGWAFAIATVPKRQDFAWGTAGLRRRLARTAALLGLGYALTLPWWAEGFPFHAPPEVWTPFWSIGVLQCIGAALALAHLVLLATRGPAAFAAGMFGSALGILAVAPVVQVAAATLPPFLRGWLNGDGVPGGFPLFPHVAYFFLGVALGTAVWLRAWPARRVAIVGGAAAAVSVVLGKALHAPVMEWMGEARFWQASPTLFLTRGGAALALLAACSALAGRVRRLPPILEHSAQRALTFYVVHMVLLWGVPWMPGLVLRLGKVLSLPSVVALTGLCLLAIAVAGQQGPRLAAWSPALRSVRADER